MRPLTLLAVLCTAILTGCGSPRGSCYLVTDEKPAAKPAILFAGPAFRIRSLRSEDGRQQVLSHPTWEDSSNAKVIEVPPGRWIIDFHYREWVETEGLGKRVIYGDGCPVNWTAQSGRTACLQVRITGENQMEPQVNERSDLVLKSASSDEPLAIYRLGSPGSTSVPISSIRRAGQDPLRLPLGELAAWIEQQRPTLIGNLSGKQ